MPIGKACKVDMSDEGNWNGTMIYQPPEHLQALLDQAADYVMTAGVRVSYTKTAMPAQFDIWSVGVIALELLQSLMPFRPKAFKRDVRDIASKLSSTEFGRKQCCSSRAFFTAQL